MNKRCTCGQEMDMTLRTVVHARTIEIHHVPVYTCTCCDHSELFPELKQDVIRLMKLLTNDESAKRKRIYFDEEHEVASVFKECLDMGGDHLLDLFNHMVVERVNHLLDIYLLAKTWGDVEWMIDIQRRLKQLTTFSATPYQVKIS
ncbi:hypothetical protein MH117_09405 [Paenibacillus sp. ACRRX]|uniref:hypothetical protein n=1 Tax=unclassified Paenibacillus TaxID=185978 RepID=UPI001EF73061|nr:MULTISPECIES: hypothetical protein [unclassified Paenibacillus]MCG7407640.1 hypothetical protein [Paenibacillus sp. ACRRX]MDK8180875.1 hypothetical protein [Paenibacillus sp. UMB4589-SE434]